MWHIFQALVRLALNRFWAAILPERLNDPDYGFEMILTMEWGRIRHNEYVAAER